MNSSQYTRFSRFYAVLAAIALVMGPAGFTARAAEPRHVVIVVMDGLRRDCVTAEQMPTLFALSRTGTFFSAHHPVYPSSTQVNATALATGTKPATSDIMANREYRPDLELLHPIDTNDQYFAWKSDVSKEPWLRVSTLPEICRANGLTTVVAGTKEVAILWDRGYGKRSVDQPTLFEGKSIPSAALDKIIPDQGPFPPGLDWKYSVNTARDIWTTRALTEKFWANGVPAFSVLWLYEPDFSQHGTGVGSKNAKLAYKSSDDRLATVLATLDKKGVRDSTDIIVASDHGCSTISRKIDTADLLRKGGFKADGTYHKKPEKGNIVVSGLGGSVAFYVVEHDEEVRQKLIAFLQKSDWAGVIFTKEGSEGTFKFSDAAIDSPDAPDVLVSLRWKDEASPYGTQGTVVCDGMDKGQGMHVSLSRYDMANTLIAVGPDFKKGWVDKLPSGNFDVAPTVAHILGLKLEHPMDGRVLAEALVERQAGDIQPQTNTLTVERQIGDKTWRQYLRVSSVDGRNYYDEGNAGAPPEK